jgi:hypothetical protein
MLEQNDFEETYDNVWDYKLKAGTGIYGVFWDKDKLNGLGDISIRKLDIINLFWESGITDIQRSRNFFHVELMDNDLLLVAYPQLEGKLGNSTMDISKYIYDDAVDTNNKSAVVDWYYKKRNAQGKVVLHYCKYVNDEVLFATENEPDYAERGWYDHGQYPVVLDILYPEEGTSAGYGFIAVGRNPQGYIDELDGHILEYANAASRVRYWAKRSLGINEREFLDPDRRIIEVEGDIDEEKLRQITLSPMDGMLTEVRKMKIDELKETTGNRDVSQGSTSGGVTAAQAIEALQEAGAKGSRDMIAGSHRAYTQIMRQVIELIRQFYDGVRWFRIVGENGGRRFVCYSNTGLQDEITGEGADGLALYRHPAFDIEVRAERENPLDRAGRNQLLLELYRAGLFDPNNRDAAERALAGMDFEGIDSLRAGIRVAGTASSEARP